MDTPAQSCIQETHLKQNDKESLKIRHVENYTTQINVCKQKAGMADSKSVRKNSGFRPLSREKRHIMTSISTANELLYTTNYNNKTHKTKL